MSDCIWDSCASGYCEEERAIARAKFQTFWYNQTGRYNNYQLFGKERGDRILLRYKLL